MKKIIFILYTCLIILFITIKIHKFEIYDAFEYNFNLFSTLKKYELNFLSLWSIINQAANIFPFIILGTIIKKTFPWNFFNVFSVISSTLILLELAQSVFRFGTFDVDDIWLNALSVIYGYVVFRGGKNEKEKKKN